MLMKEQIANGFNLPQEQGWNVVWFLLDVFQSFETQ